MAKTCLWHFTCTGRLRVEGGQGERSRKAAVPGRQVNCPPLNAARDDQWGIVR